MAEMVREERVLEQLEVAPLTPEIFHDFYASSGGHVSMLDIEKNASFIPIASEVRI
jgi:hypothetical protein